MFSHVIQMSKVPERYLAGVNPAERKKELATRKASKKPLSQLFPKKTDKQAIKQGTVRQSQFTAKFKKLYPDLKFDLKDFSRRFNIPFASLKEVYDKGIAAWKSAGSRPGASPEAWAIARVYKFILIAKGHLKEPPAGKDPDAMLRK
jgi:hypothetical protein